LAHPGPGSLAARVQIVVDPPGFDAWHDLLALLHASYAYMTGRIDPPSSLLQMDAEELERKARSEILLAAFHGERLVGCAFASERPDCVYVGKLAVDPTLQRRGIARRLLEATDKLARASGRRFIELQTRIELTENHVTFAALGFRKIAESAHPGYDRATNITMRKPLDGA